MDITIRKAEERDAAALAAMIAELFSIERDFVPAPEKHEAGIRAILARKEDAAAFVAEEADGGPVGMVTVQLVISTAQGGPSGLLEDLFVRESHRRRGVASALVAAVEDWCRSRGATRVQLLADAANLNALAFYGERGYGKTNMVCRRRFIPEDRTESHLNS
jgi:GNAT superfamily N-acetyltransferase